MSDDKLDGWRPDDLMTVPELALYLRMPVASVYQINWKGTGPKRMQVGKRVLYRKRDVDRWLDEQVIR